MFVLHNFCICLKTSFVICHPELYFIVSCMILSIKFCFSVCIKNNFGITFMLFVVACKTFPSLWPRLFSLCIFLIVKKKQNIEKH